MTVRMCICKCLLKNIKATVLAFESHGNKLKMAQRNPQGAVEFVDN